ncbi:hypothetical protein niasHT_027539 [Heterodera trifolii]|uniref:Transposase n=1 Tax=Heterodera trifolii TaxID=157864 RepID=A0ABD2K528_9BILA
MDRKNKLTLPSKRNSRESPNCWPHFPRVVAEVVEDSVSNMKSKKVEEKMKKENMKTAIQQILQNGTPVQSAVEQYGLCRTTVAKYYRIAKNKMDDCFGEEADIAFVLREHDGETLTLAQLLAILKKQTVDNNQKRKGTPIESDFTNSADPPDENKNSSVVKHSPVQSQVEPLPPSVSLSNSFMIDKILSSQSLNLEEKHPLMVDQQQNSQLLLTRRFEPITFEGTMDELRLEFEQVLRHYYHGNALQLASLMANYVRYEYELRWQQSMFGIPPHLMKSAYLLLSRHFHMKNLRLTDIDDGLAAMDVNVGGTSNNWLGH